MKKKAVLLVLVTFANCMAAHGTNTHLMSLLGEKTSWEYLHDKLVEEPSQRVKTYFERNLNLGIVKALGAGTVFSFIMAMYYGVKIDSLRDEERKGVTPDQAFLIDQQINALEENVMPWVAAFLSTILLNCLVMTPWTIWRSYFSLVRRAEKEVFLEMLRNPKETLKHAPKELIPVFQIAINRQASAPALFENELPAFIDALKKEIHKNRASA